MSVTGHRIARRRVALVGVLAVLFQAILFGWHHHPLPLPSCGTQPVVAAGNSAAPLSPATDEDECEICAALHHLSAAPGEFALLPSPATATTAPPLPKALLRARALERGFHARAPPRGSDLRV